MISIFAASDLIPMIVFIVIFLGLIYLALVIVIMRRYKRCPAGRVLVITGKTQTGAPEIIRSGGKFVWPLLQQYSYLDSQPMTVEIDAERVPVKATATVVIGVSPESLGNAISHLIGLSTDQIKEHAGNIIRGQLLQSYAEAGRNCDISELALSVQAASAMPFQRLGLELLGLVIEDGDDHRNG